jgi:hypothetical protein
LLALSLGASPLASDWEELLWVWQLATLDELVEMVHCLLHLGLVLDLGQVLLVELNLLLLLSLLQVLDCVDIEASKTLSGASGVLDSVSVAEDGWSQRSGW